MCTIARPMFVPLLTICFPYVLILSLVFTCIAFIFEIKILPDLPSEQEKLLDHEQDVSLIVQSSALVFFFFVTIITITIIIVIIITIIIFLIITISLIVQSSAVVIFFFRDPDFLEVSFSTDIKCSIHANHGRLLTFFPSISFSTGSSSVISILTNTKQKKGNLA